jgi:hypothetical protein
MSRALAVRVRLAGMERQALHNANQWSNVEGLAGLHGQPQPGCYIVSQHPDAPIDKPDDLLFR